ncbi:MAG: transcription antitermination factor NusB [Candidatus Obscuribacterales bacterium]
MKPRRIARKLALIVLGQLPREPEALNEMAIEDLVARSLHSLTEHARQLLSDAEGELRTVTSEIVDFEVDHPDNAQLVEELKEVPVTTVFLRKQVERIDRALALLSEALDLPELALHAGKSSIVTTCSKCKASSTVLFNRADRSEVRQFALQLLNTYLKNRGEVEDLVKKVKSRWRPERMMSIDRDILRLGCTELYFLPEIPVRVAVNEAVELCHEFADQKAARFINGVLADLVEDASYFRETGEHKSPTESEEPVA